MTELSYESGYFDQSHFINDFKSLCGLTPLQYFVENDVCSDFFA
jgi:AraC-like DNA-binding protein